MSKRYQIGIAGVVHGHVSAHLRVGSRRDDPVSPLDRVLQDCRAMGYEAVELMLSPNYAYGPSGPRRGGGRGPWS